MTNNSSWNPPFSSHSNSEGMAVIIKLLPIAIAIILTNGLVFFLFYKQKSLRTPSNTLLLGLAVCDFLTGAVNIPYFIIFSFEVVPTTSPMYGPLAEGVFVLHTLVAVTSGYHILAITAEKYLAIIYPFRHNFVTKKTALIVQLGIWVLGGFIATIPLAWRWAALEFVWEVVHSAACLAIVFFFPTVFMAYAYTLMFKAVREGKRPVSMQNTETKTTQTSNDRKCIFIFAIMSVIYLCCWCPYFIIMFLMNIAYYIQSNTILSSTVFDTVVETVAITRYITSVVNPILYTLFKRDFWLVLRSIFGRTTNTCNTELREADIEVSGISSLKPEGYKNAQADKNNIADVSSV